MSSYSRNNGSNYSRNAPSSSDRQRSSGYGGERYIPRDGDDRRDGNDHRNNIMLKRSLLFFHQATQLYALFNYQ